LSPEGKGKGLLQDGEGRVRGKEKGFSVQPFSSEQQDFNIRKRLEG